MYHYPQANYSLTSTPGVSSSLETINKTNFSRRHSKYDSTFDICKNLFVLAESVLPTSTTPSIYPSASSFNYSPTTHYQSYFAWNHPNSSLIRTHSDYPSSSKTNLFVLVDCYIFFLSKNKNKTAFPRVSPINSGLLVTHKSTENLSQTNPINLPSTTTTTTNPYPSYFHMIPPMNFSLPPPISLPPPTTTTNSNVAARPSKRKRSHLTARLRQEILQLKANKPTIFVWEIQQNLLQNGICTAQTLPHVKQRLINFVQIKN